MKKRVIWCLSFLLIVAIIPATAGIKGFDITDNLPTESVGSTNIGTETNLSAEELEYIICNTMEYITEESPAEAKKAILAICKNNYIYYKVQGLSPDKTDVNKYSDVFYEELCGMYNELNCRLTYKGETVYIPLTTLTGEHTSTSDEYPYMKSVASPWDVFSREHNADREYPCGVSVYGIVYLCSEGSTCEEALRWYLPEFEIKIS